MDLAIVIPCYNEVDNVPKLEREFLPVALKLCETQSVEVVFVDDGSTDGTLTALRNVFGREGELPLSIQFAQHPQNRGLGAAIRTGLAHAAGKVVVTTDSDGTYDFEEIPALLSCLAADVDIVTASPYHPDGGVAGVPGYRLILSRGSSMIYRVLVSWRVHTYTSLFRAYRREVVDAVSFEANGFLAGTELLVKGMLSGYTVAEYPTVLHRRAFGESKAKLVRTILAHLGFQLDVLLHRVGLKAMVERSQVAAGKRATG
jgi:dolichol-phosphate mannosyltransferase